jgi:hypothetical protein
LPIAHRQARGVGLGDDRGQGPSAGRVPRSRVVTQGFERQVTWPTPGDLRAATCQSDGHYLSFRTLKALAAYDQLSELFMGGNSYECVGI